MEKKETGSASESVEHSDGGSSTKSRPKSRAKKRKREPSGSSSDEDNVLPENTLEVEKNLHASAIKNNLDEDSVKKILKKVVTNDHVLAYVALREEEEDSSTEGNHVPKLTRSKVKELKKVATGKPTWNLENLELTPIKHIPVKTRPEVKALIAQELPEDEDDDEYEPTHDDVPSDDDQTLESCSDLDSQPRTPATPKQLRATSPKLVKDGPFKVPQEVTPARRKLELDKEEAEATIALRTRSKLSLSETPIEHIESSFVPPDDLPMPDVDDLWNQFLAECLDPAPTLNHEDEDETDPEYNVAADPDAHDEDEEALENCIIKISKKELSDLVTELFNVMPEATEDVTLAENMANNVLTDTIQPNISSHWEGKQEPLSDDESQNNFARRISDRITFERRDSTGFSTGKIEPEPEPEQPVYLEIGALPVQPETNTKTVEVVKTVETQSLPNTKTGEVIKTVETQNLPNTKTGETVKTVETQSLTNSKTGEAVKTVETQIQSQMRGGVCLNAPLVQVVKGNPLNVVSIVVGQQANAVPIKLAPALDGEKVPISLQRHQIESMMKMKTKKQKTKITRVEVHMNAERCILPEQIIILQQQLRMHIQLAASNFLQLFVHPLNYGFGPTYKGFIESLVKMADKTPNSVVEVCNLRPALELITNWEKKVSENTPENTAYIQFVQDDCAKWARRMAQNNYYKGEFHDMFKKAVAESTVFLYPYLLPPKPYHNRQKRNSYLVSEDELIALGLDQFWQYVKDNPKLYPDSKIVPSRRRWWLNTTIELISKHMLPFLSVRMLLAHIHNVKKNDPDNPINKFLATQTISAVEHRILPFNETATLYDQPVEEMPRLWLKYLAQSDPKFRKYMFSRHKNHAGAPPIGIPLKVNLDPNIPVMKAPLPMDFTKKITLKRKKKTEVPTTTNNVETKDITNNLKTADNTVKNIKNIRNKNNSLQADTNSTNLQTPEGVATNITNIDPVLAANILKLDKSATGQKLVPLIIQVNTIVDEPTSTGTTTIDLTETPSDDETNMKPQTSTVNSTPNTLNTRSVTSTVNCNNSPITSTRSNPQVSTPKPSLKVLPISDKPTHCTCCILLRKVCKRQTRITEYFAKHIVRSIPKYCFCKEMKHPKITKKLIHLVNTFKDPFRIAVENLTVKWAELDQAMRKKLKKKRRKYAIVVNEVEESTSTDAEDLSYVINYKMKLMARLGPSIDLKFKVHSIFSKFDTHTGDPLSLAQSLCEVLTGPHAALFRDFLAFLTAEQAARVGKFRDYFALVRIGELVKMVEEEIAFGESRRVILEKLHMTFARVGVPEPTACEICTALLPTFSDYPKLAERVFKLFPHNIAQEEKKVENNNVPPSSSPTCEKERNEVSTTSDDAEEEMDTQKDQSNRTENDKVPALPPQVLQPPSLPFLQPVTVQSPTVQPVTIQSPTVLPPTVQPPIVQPPIVQPSILQPPILQPSTVQPPIVQPSTVQPSTIETQKVQPPNSTEQEKERLGKSDSTLHGETSHTDVTLTKDDDRMQVDYEADHSSSSEEDADPSDDETELETTKEEPEITEEESEEQTNENDDKGTNELNNAVTNAKQTDAGNEVTNHNENEETANEVLKNVETIKQEYPIENNIQIFISDIKSEKDSDEYSVQDNTETHQDTRDSDSEMSLVIDSDEGTVKSEISEWKREEDKLILQVIKDNLTLEERGDKPILEFIEDKQVIHLLSGSLIHKSIEEIRDRIIYLLQMLLRSGQ